MKNVLASLVVLMASSSALADFGAPATLDILCSPAAGAVGPQVRIISSSEGSSVSYERKMFTGDQLTAGTEGGAPYLQSVNNEGGYNITVEGGDLEKAFNDNVVIEDGEASAVIDFFNTGKSYIATCKGSFSFTTREIGPRPL